MKRDDEHARFEEMLRRRGVSAKGNPVVEREILENFQDDCAVLILDSSGFTRLTQKYGIIHFLSLFLALRGVVEPLFKPHHAIGNWADADNIFAIFPTAKFAVECALAVQEAVRASNEPRSADDRLDVCIGVGSGKMLRVGKTNIFGDEMNLASKLGEDVAGPGEILLTDHAYEEVRELVAGHNPEPCATRISGVEIPYFKIRCALAR
jgi:class 3 adenylate cyclase